MKYVLIALVFCACVVVGYVISNRFTKRKKFWSSMIAFADKLAIEINFSRERLRVLIENFDDTNKKNLLGIDKKFIDYLDKKCDLTTDEVFGKNELLKQDEKEFILLFLKTLGRSDVENQTKEIKSFIERFNEIKTQCDTEQKKYGALSMKLGIIAGLFCAIIMF